MIAWYAVYTQPHAETKAAEHLLRQGYSAYLPRYRTWVSHARRRQPVLRPLFPRYLFAGVDRASMPVDLAVTAETGDRLVMALSHRSLPVHGVQFHPESIASEHGHLILKNFLDVAATWNAASGRRAPRRVQGRRRGAERGRA